MTGRYPEETLDPDYDCGVMPSNVATLADAVVGHRIVSAEKSNGLVLTLDNGKKVILRDSNDCCAYTELESFLLHPESVDHVIMGVGTTKGYDTWHIYADFGDVMELHLGWSCGNPFYYGYGFYITVEDI